MLVEYNENYSIDSSLDKLLIVFHRKTCPPCKQCIEFIKKSIDPIFHKNILLIDTDNKESLDILKNNEIKATPTIVKCDFTLGKVYEFIEGFDQNDILSFFAN